MYNRFERFSLAVSEISRHLHKLTSEEMENYGLKGVHGVYLLALARFPEGLTAPQLCEACGKDKSDVSRMMKIMEGKGLVVKDGGFQNRYGGVFRLTEQGTAVAVRIRVTASRAVEVAGADLTDEQREIFYGALESITRRLRKMELQSLAKEQEPEIERNDYE